VIKVEPPVIGDECRRRGPFLDDEPGPDRSGLFQYVNSGKEGITLNLRSVTGRALLHQLAARCDVLVADKAPAEAREMGLDWETLHAVNPALIVMSVTPYGQDGPLSSWKATDITVYNLSGLAYATPGLVADPDTNAPLRAGGSQGSFAAGLNAAINLFAGLLLKDPADKNFAGFHIDFSCAEAQTAILSQNVASYAFHGAGLNRDIARGSGAGGMASTRNVRCKDGYVQIHISGMRQWELFRELLGDPDWMNDPRMATAATRRRNWPFLRENVEAWTRDYTRHELFFLLQGRKVACSPVMEGEDLINDAGLESRDFWRSIGGDPHWKMPRGPARFSKTEWLPRQPAPTLGQHNQEIFCGELGYTREELVRLSQAGIV
jgi:crotonobetainyl-CoA:carnitine CoA-transferase CaiB-like acyl-CoA transferase